MRPVSRSAASAFRTHVHGLLTEAVVERKFVGAIARGARRLPAFNHALSVDLASQLVEFKTATEAGLVLVCGFHGATDPEAWRASAQPWLLDRWPFCVDDDLPPALFLHGARTIAGLLDPALRQRHPGIRAECAAALRRAGFESVPEDALLASLQLLMAPGVAAMAEALLERAAVEPLGLPSCAAALPRWADYYAALCGYLLEVESGAHAEHDVQAPEVLFLAAVERAQRELAASRAAAHLEHAQAFLGAAPATPALPAPRGGGQTTLYISQDGSLRFGRDGTGPDVE